MRNFFLRFSTLFALALHGECLVPALPLISRFPSSVTACRDSSFALHSSPPLYYHDGDEIMDVVETAASVTSSSAAASSYSRPAIHRRSSQDTSSISMSLITSIWLNQLTLLLFVTSIAVFTSFFGGHPLDISGLHWNGIHEFHSLFDWKLSWFRVVEGVLATIPMVAVGCMVENSDKRDFTLVNFSTTNMVISLFGRRKSNMEPTASSPSQVMLLSAAIGMSTGVSEELIFRGYIPTAFASITHSIPLALLGQAILFAGGHLSKKARPEENRLVGSLQLFNGLWYGLVYLMSGGDVLPCIISHILYDCHILCETWMVINDQMDYTQESSQSALDEEERRSISRLQEKAGALLNTDTISFARRFFFAFDYDHVGRLSLSDCKRAINYAFMNDKAIPDTKTVEDLFEWAQQSRMSPHTSSEAVSTALPDRLNFPEFLQVLLVLRSNYSSNSS